MGESTIDIYNMMGYDAAALGNHEFDKGQEELADRVAQSEFPWLGANVVLEGTDWDLPDWAMPYEILDVGGIELGVLGLAGEETPTVTLLGTTAGLVFKDLTETILHYYDEIMDQADGMIVLVHMGTADSGPYDGLETVAQNLIDAGSPVDLMIGGHQHEALFDPVYVGDTAIVSAGYYGRWLGRIDITVDPSTKELSVVDYGLITITGGPTVENLLADVNQMYEDGLISSPGIYNSLVEKLEGALAKLHRGSAKAAANQLNAFVNHVAALSGKKIDSDAADGLLTDAEWLLANTDLAVAARIAYWAEVVAPIVNEPVGATNIDLTRDYNDESLIGDIVTDSMRWKADEYDDGVVNGSVDIAFTNSGGLRADILIPDGAALPYTITWGDTFEVLPFGNTLYLMDLTGVQIQEVLDQSASLYKGILQTSGATWEWYNNTGDDTATIYGALNIEVGGVPLDTSAVYRIVTNNFVAGGQDGYITFGAGTNRWDTYYDMQQGFVEYIGTIPDGVIDTDDIPGDRIINVPVP
jgi:2',3'-cyclic-nucleotide 2'-phosphodiesterase (5'-nucleotidase family)